jgi:hypothetical protein
MNVVHWMARGDAASPMLRQGIPMLAGDQFNQMIVGIAEVDTFIVLLPLNPTFNRDAIGY